jgi:hypothetical protein
MNAFKKWLIGRLAYAGATGRVVMRKAAWRAI